MTWHPPQRSRSTLAPRWPSRLSVVIVALHEGHCIRTSYPDRRAWPAGVFACPGLFQPPESRTRAFAGAGVGLVHSTGHFTTRTSLPGLGGFPVEGPTVRTDWSLTKPAFELGGGVSIRSGD